MNRTLAVHANGLIGKKVTLFGWVDTIRDHGKISFLDIKDSSGVIQTVAKKQYDVSPQDVVKIQGTVKKRPENLINKNLPTGEIEVEIENLEIYSKAQTPPIPTEGDGYDIEENLRLKFRYLDLRRQRLQKNLKIRHEIAKLFRAYL